MYSRFLLPQDKIVLIGTDEAIRAAAERNEKASLIIGRALESGVDWKEMSGFVLAWLKHCGGSGSAQFVFRSWLNSGGDVD